MGVYYVSGIPYSSDYLMHFGIKGQKWGVRRFQNEDGTLTDSGKKRYAKDLKKLNSINRKANKTQKVEARYEKKLYKKKYGALSKFSSAKSIVKTDQKYGKAKIKADKYRLKGMKMQKTIQERFGNVPISELDAVKVSLGKRARRYL